MARPAPYSYSDAGFNGFFRRTLSSNPGTQVLASNSRPTRQMNFDDLQISGALGDKLKIGSIVLDGKTGRISIQDEVGTEVVRIGNVDG